MHLMRAKTKASPVVRQLKMDRAAQREGVRRLASVLTRFRYEGKPFLGRNAREARDVLELFTRNLSSHMRLQEKTVFPYLQKHLPRLGPVVLVLRSEHRELVESLERFRRLLRNVLRFHDGIRYVRQTLDELIETGHYVNCLVSHHFRAENKILLAIVERDLRDSEKQDLSRRVGHARR